MLVRIQRIGAGTLADQFRVPLPTYNFVADDAAGGNQIVDVPASEFPPGILNNPGLAIAATVAGNTIVGIPPGILNQWIAHLQTRYGAAYNPVVR